MKITELQKEYYSEYIVIKKGETFILTISI